MASGLRRLAVLGPAGTITPGSAQDYRAYANRAFVAATHTRWLRLWADWPTLMPSRGTFDAARLASLDAQIAAARKDGLSIVLTLYRFPTWANGVAAMSDTQLAATMPDRRTASQTDDRAKSVLLRVPDDLSPGGDWAAFAGTLARRYSRLNPGRPSKTTYIDWLEIANEPNYMWWPQQAPSTTADPYAQGEPIVHRAVARMLQTALGISSALGGEPGIMAPGTADNLDTSRLRTAYGAFADALLDELTALGVRPGARCAWTHHDYGDVTYDLGPGSTAPDAATNATRQTNRAADARRRLVGRWAAWPNADAANPWVFLTEGGVTLPNIGAHWGITDPAQQRAKQADLLQRAWSRLTTTSDGAGIAALGWYLFYSDPNYDCGLCEPQPAGGAARPAYDAWAALPSNA